MRAAGFLSGLALVCLGATAGMADDVAAPRLSFATVDWPAAVAALSAIEGMRPVSMSAKLRLPARPVAPALRRLNGMMSQRFSGVGTSPVPVLLPFDVEALLRDQAAAAEPGGNERYMSGFQEVRFFDAGPAGYDAAFAIRAGDVPELSDITFANPIEVQISGSALLYDLDAPMTPDNLSVTNLDEEFPGIRRMILEHHLRYTFVRYGVPYVVSIVCFDGNTARYKLPTC